MIKGSCHCGSVTWQLDVKPETATLCDCSVCRRYGVLWAYDFDGEAIHVDGGTQAYIWGKKYLGFHFCPNCACVAYWRAIEPRENGKFRIAVNLRLAEPEQVADIPIHYIDGSDKGQIPNDDKCVRDYFF